MTPQERSMLGDFLGKLTSVHNINKDSEADSMIRQAMSAQPDAGYILVQNMLLMQHTLTEMNAKIKQLEEQQSHSSSQNNNSSFLGAQSQNAVRSYFGSATTPSPAQQQPQQAYYGQPQQQQSSGFGDFMRSAGTTAAGVAGGMLLFDGVSSLFGGHSISGFGGGYENTGGTTINNNYYSEPQADTGSNDFLGSSDVDNVFDNSSDSGFDDNPF